MHDVMPITPIEHHWNEARLGPLRERTIRLPRSGLSFTILQPLDIDRLLDLATTDPEEHLPYWAEVWPSGIALADALILEPEIARGLPTLELGCGLGITAIAALFAGAQVLAIDYSHEALHLTRVNCERNTRRQPLVYQMNWRQLPADLISWATRTRLPLILAADVLYEQRDIAPLRTLVETLLAPDGLLWLAEPGRDTAATFLQELFTRGWQDEPEVWLGPWPDTADRSVQVTVHRLRRPSR